MVPINRLSPITDGILIGNKIFVGAQLWLLYFCCVTYLIQLYFDTFTAMHQCKSSSKKPAKVGCSSKILNGYGPDYQ